MTYKKILIPISLISVLFYSDAQDTAELETVLVEGDIADTSGSYLIPEMRSASKTDQSILEIPQAVTVLTRKQIDNQSPQSVGQALRYTAGVLSEIDASTRYDSFFLRGFGGFGTSTQFVSFLDGLRLPKGQAFGQASIDPFLLDRIDILKGPSALMYGQSSPGGLVNLVSRKPNGSTGGSAKLEYGSNNRLQLSVEQQGTLDKSDTLQYNVAAVALDADSRYDDVEEKSFSIASNLVWVASPNTRFSLGGFLGTDPEGGYFNSIYPTSLAPEYADELSRDLNIGDPDFDSYDRTQWGVYADVEHALSHNATVKSKLRFSHVDSKLAGIQMAGSISNTGVIPRVAAKSDEDINSLSWDTNFEYLLETGNISHQLLTGIDVWRNDSDWRYQIGSASSLDVNAPVYDGGGVGTFATYTDNTQVAKQVGVYASDQMSFGNLEAVFGARYDWVNTKTNNKLTNTVSEQDSNSASYRAALLYGFDSGVTPYISYSTSFQPTIGVDASGNSFKPISARQAEIGIKYQPLNNDMLLTLAAFDIHQKNVLTASSTLGFYEQTGAVRSRGLELEARGKVSEQLEMIASATLLDTEVTKSNNADAVGKRLQAVPKYFGSLWVNYGFKGALDGLEAGVGIRHVGSSYGDDANTVKADAYTLVDLGFSYDFGQKNTSLKGWEATLNIRNLFDKNYYSSCSYNIYCQYGEERSIMLGVKKAW